MQSTHKTKETETHASSYWIIFFILLALWIAGLIISQEVRDISAKAWSFIISDWQVFGAFMTLVFFTIVWTFFEGVSSFLHYIYLTHPDSYFYVKHALRFIIISFFALLVILRYITIWDFQDAFLYVTAGAFTALLCAIWFRGSNYTNIVKKDIERTAENMKRSDYYDYFYVRFDQVILVSAIIGASLIFMWYYLSRTVSWIVEFVDVVLPQFITNPVIFVLFVSLLCVTIFSPVFQFLADYLPPLAGRKTLSIQTKARIKKVRAWSLGFLACVLFIKLVPGFNIASWGKDLLSLGTLLLSWLISTYRNKILHSK
jgi:hypothetical protein